MTSLIPQPEGGEAGEGELLHLVHSPVPFPPEQLGVNCLAQGHLFLSERRELLAHFSAQIFPDEPVSQGCSVVLYNNWKPSLTFKSPDRMCVISWFHCIYKVNNKPPNKT